MTGLVAAIGIVLALFVSHDHKTLKRAERTCACSCRYIDAGLSDMPPARAGETRRDGGPGYLVCATGADGKAYLKRLALDADAAYFARIQR